MTGGAVRRCLVKLCAWWRRRSCRHCMRARDALVRRVPEFRAGGGATDGGHRTAIIEIVREALAAAEARCRAGGVETHWEVFVLCVRDGLSIEEVQARTGIPARRAEQMRGLAGERFAAALREILVRRGVRFDRVEEAVRQLRERLL